MNEFINTLIDNLNFIFERLDWLSILDILLVAGVFYAILLLLRDTQAMVLLRGVLLVIALVSLLSTQENLLPAFSWLVERTLPALLLVIPVIFAPEIRRGLERFGRPGTLLSTGGVTSERMEVIATVVTASSQLSKRRHGALIVMQHLENLHEYVQTGIPLGAQLTPELLLQVFYPNTPLHDGAVIISGSNLVAAACVMPLSASGILIRSPERLFGLRHRAALGISEVSDAVAVVVSEETGLISIAQGGHLQRALDAGSLENALLDTFAPFRASNPIIAVLARLFPGLLGSRREAG